MLAKILHRAASHPLVYDLIQRLAGAARIRHFLTTSIAPWADGVAVVLDIGGGTGTYRSIWRFVLTLTR